MGIVLWLACAAAVFFLARAVPFARPIPWKGELFAAVISALLLGELATALDFGGWNEPDWRAGLFVFLGTAAVVGVIRVMRLISRKDRV
jgi:hypothetical protein